ALVRPLVVDEAVNDEGATIALGTAEGWTHLYYCGRFFGTDIIPGSDGRCGPADGPQCPSCRRYRDRLPDACGSVEAPSAASSSAADFGAPSCESTAPSLAECPAQAGGAQAPASSSASTPRGPAEAGAPQGAEDPDTAVARPPAAPPSSTVTVSTDAWLNLRKERNERERHIKVLQAQVNTAQQELAELARVRAKLREQRQLALEARCRGKEMHEAARMAEEEMHTLRLEAHEAAEEERAAEAAREEAAQAAAAAREAEEAAERERAAAVAADSAAQAEAEAERARSIEWQRLLSERETTARELGATLQQIEELELTLEEPADRLAVGREEAGEGLERRSLLDALRELRGGAEPEGGAGWEERRPCARRPAPRWRRRTRSPRRRTGCRPRRRGGTCRRSASSRTRADFRPPLAARGGPGARGGPQPQRPDEGRRAALRDRFGRGWRGQLARGGFAPGGRGGGLALGRAAEVAGPGGLGGPHGHAGQAFRGELRPPKREPARRASRGPGRPFRGPSAGEPSWACRGSAGDGSESLQISVAGPGPRPQPLRQGRRRLGRRGDGSSSGSGGSPSRRRRISPAAPAPQARGGGPASAAPARPAGSAAEGEPGRPLADPYGPLGAAEPVSPLLPARPPQSPRSLLLSGLDFAALGVAECDATAGGAASKLGAMPRRLGAAWLAAACLVQLPCGCSAGAEKTLAEVCRDEASCKSRLDVVTKRLDEVRTEMHGKQLTISLLEELRSGILSGHRIELPSAQRQHLEKGSPLIGEVSFDARHRPVSTNVSRHFTHVRALGEGHEIRFHTFMPLKKQSSAAAGGKGGASALIVAVTAQSQLFVYDLEGEALLEGVDLGHAPGAKVTQVVLSPNQENHFVLTAADDGEMRVHTLKVVARKKAAGGSAGEAGEDGADGKSDGCARRGLGVKRGAGSARKPGA
ncbi:unnamed protein product, partial [Prorocentrum cordatum]